MFSNRFADKNEEQKPLSNERRQILKEGGDTKNKRTGKFN